VSDLTVFIVESWLDQFYNKGPLLITTDREEADRMVESIRASVPDYAKHMTTVRTEPLPFIHLQAKRHHK
jgi:hypothetical protein